MAKEEWLCSCGRKGSKPEKIKHDMSKYKHVWWRVK